MKQRAVVNMLLAIVISAACSASRTAVETNLPTPAQDVDAASSVAVQYLAAGASQDWEQVRSLASSTSAVASSLDYSLADRSSSFPRRWGQFQCKRDSSVVFCDGCGDFGRPPPAGYEFVMCLVKETSWKVHSFEIVHQRIDGPAEECELGG